MERTRVGAHQSPFQTHHHETRRRLGCQADHIGPTIVYTHCDLPWRYFNHTVVVDWGEPASAEAACASLRRMHGLGKPASFEMETFETNGALDDDSEFFRKLIRAKENVAQSAAWASVLTGVGCSECDRLLVMAQPLAAAKPDSEPDFYPQARLAGAARESDQGQFIGREASFAAQSPLCRITTMPLRAIDRQVQLHRAGFGAGGRLASVDRQLVTANLRAGVQYFWARPPAHPEPVGSVAIMVIEDVAEIFALSVVPAYRGQGIGRELIETSLQYAAGRGCSLAYLQSEINSPAATLYERLGFVPLWQQVSYVLY